MTPRRLRYWLLARHCTCRAWPHRLHANTVQHAGTLHRTRGPCLPCDTYGRT